MDLGEYSSCLNVADLQASLEFYSALGFKIIENHRAENWAVLQHNNLALCLFQGHIERNMMNFRGADIQEIAAQIESKGLELSKPAHQEEDGSWSAEIIDPDGNVIYFNTFPDEREKYLKTGKLSAL
ncbi:MAG: VOC family protein [Chloroflexi bacterium]|nr:VOC family protein [Chloroflexota bacterium]MQC26530.1 VOC family protein [Chloroflexota bacterium]